MMSTDPVARPRGCHYCGALGKLTKDHIVPLGVGGVDLHWNTVQACAECNARRGSSWPTCDCLTCSEAVRVHAEVFGVTSRTPGAKRGRLSKSARQRLARHVWAKTRD